MDGMRSRLLTMLVGAVVGFAAVTGGVAISRSLSDEGGCQRTVAHPEWSVARQWDEALLDAIRRDVPAPTVHSRNLYHTSAAMWDAWAAYEPAATGVFVDEELAASDVQAAREEAMSYAAYRILVERYANAAGASDSLPEFDRLMDALCYPTDVTLATGDSPAALGNRIADTILAATIDDGSNEEGGYAGEYVPVNEPLEVAKSGTTMNDPNRWQPLLLEQSISQNGIPIENPEQVFIGPHWGHVTSFALPPDDGRGVPLDPGPPPHLEDPATDQEFKAAAEQVIYFSSLLDPRENVIIDISPATLGNNPLGTMDGHGYAVNPATGEPYAPDPVNQADFGRAIAEFWADGPSSETPPGHWNTLANTVSDILDPDLRIAGTGDTLDRLQWDVKLYLALNGANHDAAIAAWGAKGYYDYVRPISMIRYMGGLGQSSDPDGPSYNPDGLPLVPGLVEVITPESSAPGERHEALADHVGEIAIYAWSGNPDDPDAELGGVDWILAGDWVPYQRPTFVTPSFAGYISGHSSFSRAAAEVLTAFTGSPYFPGGLGEWTIPANSFKFETGPAQDVVLQWATYADASDQAGISRLYGGIHVRADDFAGRIIGYECGQAAWAMAQMYYGEST